MLFMLRRICAPVVFCIISAAAVGATTATEAASTSGTAGRKPNIIYIMADDLGREALSCYGNDLNKTPHLDALAESGMKFTNAHATPLCTPSRVQVMTGKYNNRNYVVFGVMDNTQKTFAHYLKDAGYATGIAGKWQLLGNKQQRKKAGGRAGTTPQQAGFDSYCLWQVDTLGSRYKNPTITSNTSGTQTYEGQYGPDIFSDYVVQFVRDHRSEPFFLYYPMALTHDPFQPTPDDPDYATAPVPGTNDWKYFKEQVEYMDKLVGRLVEEVDQLGLAEDTVIIFIGDNGTGKPVISTVKGKPVPGAKGESIQTGTNVPLIVSWKGKIKPGQVNENLVDLTDFLPTFLQVAGQQVPADAHLDGYSLLPQLLGKPGPKRDAVFCYYHPQIHNDKKAAWAHDKRWKLYANGRFYDMEKDPLEEHPIPAPTADGEGMEPDARAARERLQKLIDEKLKTGEQNGVKAEVTWNDGKRGDDEKAE